MVETDSSVKTYEVKGDFERSFSAVTLSMLFKLTGANETIKRLI